MLNVTYTVPFLIYVPFTQLHIQIHTGLFLTLSGTHTHSDGWEQYGVSILTRNILTCEPEKSFKSKIRHFLLFIMDKISGMCDVNFFFLLKYHAPENVCEPLCLTGTSIHTRHRHAAISGLINATASLKEKVAHWGSIRPQVFWNCVWKLDSLWKIMWNTFQENWCQRLDIFIEINTNRSVYNPQFSLCLTVVTLVICMLLYRLTIASNMKKWGGTPQRTEESSILWCLFTSLCCKDCLPTSEPLI